MNIRKTNTILHLGAATMLVAGAIALIGAVVLPLEDHSTSIATTSSPSESKASNSDLPPLDDFAPVFAVNLRGQTGATPSTQRTVAATAGLTLVGTVGDRIALMRGAGEVEARSIGDHFDGAELLAVRAGEADMRTADGIVTLRKQSEELTPDYIHGVAKP